MKKETMKKDIHVFICPKDELGYSGERIREKFAAVSTILEMGGFELEVYMSDLDIATGRMPEENYETLAQALDPYGFLVDQPKTLHAF